MSTPLKLVQYVVVRRDLLDIMKWPVGAVMAQACHACTAVIHLNYEDTHTQEYLLDLDNMHKVILEVFIKFCLIFVRIFLYKTFHFRVLFPA